MMAFPDAMVSMCLMAVSMALLFGWLDGQWTADGEGISESMLFFFYKKIQGRMIKANMFITSTSLPFLSAPRSYGT